MTTWASVELASSSTTGPPSAHDHSMVNLNNLALACFLRRDFDQAKEHLRRAHDLCLRKLKACPPSTASLPMSLMEPVVGREDSDTTDKDTVMMNEEDEHETTTATHGGKQSCHDNIVTLSSLNSEWNRLMEQTDGVPSNEDDSMAFPERTRTQLMTPLSTCPTAVYTMYNRALVLSSSGDEDPDMLVRTRAVLLYNLALVHHNIGIHQGVSSAFWEALQHYELALDILDRHMSRECDPRRRISSTTLSCAWRILYMEKLLLAILNNMGSIHAHLCHLENTRACMESLRMVLEASAAVSSILQYSGDDGTDAMSTADSNETTSNTLAMSEDYIFFLLNSLFQGKELLLAAAA
jgi:tetratricopeptide (TPR) repeat protein